ncbi:MAG: SHOCT domain-containing protein [Coprobacillus sp.]
MARNIKVKPGKTQSLIGFISGIVFVCIGIFVAIPTFGPFGIFWTIIALIITVTNAINAFGSKGVAMYDVSIEDNESSQSVEERLKKLDSLYNQRLITQEEYDQKRKEILKEI